MYAFVFVPTSMTVTLIRIIRGSNFGGPHISFLENSEEKIGTALECILWKSTAIDTYVLPTIILKTMFVLYKVWIRSRKWFIQRASKGAAAHIRTQLLGSSKTTITMVCACRKFIRWVRRPALDRSYTVFHWICGTVSNQQRES